MRIKAALYNADHLEYGLVTIPFPIPQDQYNDTIKMLEALDIGDPRAKDCMVEEIEGCVPSLKCLEGHRINVDELDYLVKRLDSFSDGELVQFQGMAAKMGLSDMTDLINLTFCCQAVTIITDFSDLEGIGRLHYMNLYGGGASIEELEQLNGVETALRLITENEGIVSHPFTSTGVTAAQNEDGNITVVDLLHNKEDYAKWKEMVGKQIDSAENACQVFFLLNKPYYLTFLKFSAPVLSQEDLGQLLAHAWILEECPNQDRNVSKRELLALFHSVPPELLMDEEEYAVYQSLEDPVTVYRGVTSYNAKNIKALSWTLDRDTAEWFAHRFGEEGTVYEAQISKEHILAFFNGRNESEVVVDSKYLEQIMESPKPEMEMQMT